MVGNTHFTLCLEPSRCSINTQGCRSCYSPGLSQTLLQTRASQGPKSTPLGPAELPLLRGEAGPNPMELHPLGLRGEALNPDCRELPENSIIAPQGPTPGWLQSWGHKDLEEIFTEFGVETLSSGPKEPSSIFFSTQPREFDPTKQSRRQKQRQQKDSGRNLMPNPASGYSLG